MKRFWAVLLSYLIFLQGCAGTRPLLMREVPRSPFASPSAEAYRDYAKRVKKPQHPYELLNLGVLAYDAGDNQRASACFSEGEEFTHRDAPLLEKTMIHYYRGLTYLAQQNKPAAQHEGERIAAHLKIAGLADSTAGDYQFAQWSAGMLAMAGDPVPVASDNGRVIVICEAGMLPSMRTEEAVVPVYQTDQRFVPGDSAQFERGRRLRERWRNGERLDEPPLGYVSAKVRDYTMNPWHATSVGSVEIQYDTAGIDHPAYMADVAAIQIANMQDRQIRTLAVAPLNYAEEYSLFPESYYQDDEFVYSSIADDKNYDRADRPQEKREGRRQPPESPPEKKKSDDAAKARKQETEKKKEEEKQKDDSDDSAGGIVGAIAVAVFAGIFIAAAYGIKSAIGGGKDKGQVEPSWETLPVKIYSTTLTLPPGTHDVRAVFKDGSGRELHVDHFGWVQINPGQTMVLRARCMN